MICDTDGSNKAVVILLQDMKRAFQVVSLFVALVLAAQPGLAGSLCNIGTPASEPCVPHCPMAMGQMGMDCQMPMQASGAGCEQECCRYTSLQAIAPFGAKATLKAIRAQFSLAGPAVPQIGLSAFTAPSPGDLIAAAPARHILLQVFRI